MVHKSSTRSDDMKLLTSGRLPVVVKPQAISTSPWICPYHNTNLSRYIETNLSNSLTCPAAFCLFKEQTNDK